MTDSTPETQEFRTQAGRETNGEARRIDTSTREPQSQDQTIQSMQIELAELRAIVARKLEESKGLIVMEPPISQVEPTMSIEALHQRDDFIKHVIGSFFVEDIHYGVPFPNSKDKMLKKAGAEWFASGFGVRPAYVELDAIVVPGEAPRVFYRYRCDLVFVRTGQIVGSAEGICSSDEDKYKYRHQNYTCPSCHQETIMKSTFGAGGWYCNAKKGGCGAKYSKGEASIENQPKPGRVLNTEVAGLAHTISAMAQKRAFVLALRGAFGLSAYIKYFEGIDDVGDDDNGNGMTVEGTATVKDSVPARTRKHLETIAQEKSTAQEPERGQETVNPPAIDGEHWSLKTEPRANFDRAMTNNQIADAVMKTALGAVDDSASLDALLLGYNSVGAAITTVLTYVKEQAAS